MINWFEVETVLLDMDGTLLDLKFDNHFWQVLIPSRYAEKNGMEFEQAIKHLMPIFKAQEGQLNWYCVDYWSAVLGLNVAELKREEQEKIKVLPNTRAFLSELKKLGKRCVLVTNAHSDSLSLKMQKTGLVEFFDAIVSAHDIGFPKEQQAFWVSFYALEQCNLKKTLLIDDSLSVLKAAKEFGVRHVVAIAHPDSSELPRTIKDFPSIAHLGDIAPSSLTD
jgi:putative hydrolase of the HAD superfamily